MLKYVALLLGIVVLSSLGIWNTKGLIDCQNKYKHDMTLGHQAESAQNYDAAITDYGNASVDLDPAYGYIPGAVLGDMLSVMLVLVLLGNISIDKRKTQENPG